MKDPHKEGAKPRGDGRHRARRSPKKMRSGSPSPQAREGSRIKLDRGHADAARRAWCVGAILAAGFLAYSDSFTGAFVFDDYPSIVLNERIKDLDQPGRILGGTDRPIVLLSFAVNHALGGLDPLGYHVFNLGVHLLAGLTLFGLMRRTLLLAGFGGDRARSATNLAAVAALLWTVHPLQTQSVTYVVQRGESMMGLAYLATLYAVVRGATAAKGRWWYAAAVAICALGMGCKAVMVTAPVMVFLFDWVFLARSFRETVRRRWGLYAGLVATWGVLAAVGVFRLLFFPKPSAVPSMGFHHAGTTPLEYLTTQTGVILHYLRLSFVPHPLCLDYQWSIAGGAGEIIVPALVVAALLGATLVTLLSKSLRWAGFIGAWFFIILSPTSSIVPIRDLAFEHRMYLPLLAPVVLMVMLVHFGLEGLSRRKALPQVVIRRGPAILVLLAVGVLGSMTFARNLDYRSQRTMWQSVLDVRPENARAWCSLGTALNVEGLSEEAVVALRRSVALDPTVSRGHVNLGKTLSKQGRFAEAIPCYEAGLAIYSDLPWVHNSLGVAYQNTGRPRKALDAYSEAVRLDPNDMFARFNYAMTLGRFERYVEQIDQFKAVVRRQPGDLEARLQLVVAELRAERFEDAARDYRSVAARRPSHAKLHRQIGKLWQDAGRLTEAASAYTAAVGAEPGSADSRCELAAILIDLGQTQSAIRHVQEVLSTDPRHVRARYLLGRALQAEGRNEEARAAYRQALELDPQHEPSRRAIAGITSP